MCELHHVRHPIEIGRIKVLPISTELQPADMLNQIIEWCRVSTTSEDGYRMVIGEGESCSGSGVSLLQ
jgi:hypothetical protein